MEVRLTPEQEALIQQAVAGGRFKTPEDVVRDAVARWEEDERERADLIASIDEADADFEAGRCREYTDETLPQLAEEIKREARAMFESRRR